MLRVSCGTAGYMSPEILNGSPINLKSDIFSLGSILFSMLTLKNLFPGWTYEQVVFRNAEANTLHIHKDLKRCSA